VHVTCDSGTGWVGYPTGPAATGFEEGGASVCGGSSASNSCGPLPPPPPPPPKSESLPQLLKSADGFSFHAARRARVGWGVAGGRGPADPARVWLWCILRLRDGHGLVVRLRGAAGVGVLAGGGDCDGPPPLHREERGWLREAGWGAGVVRGGCWQLGQGRKPRNMRKSRWALAAICGRGIDCKRAIRPHVGPQAPACIRRRACAGVKKRCSGAARLGVALGQPSELLTCLKLLLCQNLWWARAALSLWLPWQLGMLRPLPLSALQLLLR
jgi:hypothetical protein